MSYARKNLKNVLGAIAGVVVLAAIAVWQFYLFVTFTSTPGVSNAQGGTSHLWWAAAMAVFACGAAFLVFSVFLRHDTDDELHITSAPRATTFE
jgi:Kef-type K+ transport system membrane component KefB